MAKTVYVLGAGFSKPAGFPLQGEVLDRLIRTILNPDFLGPQFIPLESAQGVEDFLRHARFIQNDELSAGLSLEDLFTLLDQAIVGRGSYCGFTWHKLIHVRDKLVRCILGLLHECSTAQLAGADKRFQFFAAQAILDRIQAGQSGDPFSIVSLNWDSLVEDSIFQVLRETGGIRDELALADVDYCVYTRKLADSMHTPSTKQKAMGIHNIKVLKLHGSATWLRCPSSNHIYTGLGSSQSALDLYVNEQRSPFIDEFKDPREADQPSMLEPFIITPTYSKVFDLPHIQTTWHNAFVELREADEVVFIGYSMPEADYHFRTLLRRAIRSTTPVRVFLHAADDPDAEGNAYFKPKASNPDELERSRDPKAIYPAERYRQLFCKEQLLPPDYRGVEGFIADHAPEATHEGRMTALRGRFEELWRDRPTLAATNAHPLPAEGQRAPVPPPDSVLTS